LDLIVGAVFNRDELDRFTTGARGCLRKALALSVSKGGSTQADVLRFAPYMKLH